MKNMIEQIVEMDKKAQELTADAQRRKVESGQEVQKLREKIQSDYLELARKRLKVNKEIETQAADAAFLQVKAHYKEIENKMETQYAKKKNEWVNQLVNRVIGE